MERVVLTNWEPILLLRANVTVTIGNGGGGGQGGNTGASGAAGGNTTFGALLTAMEVLVEYWVRAGIVMVMAELPRRVLTMAVPVERHLLVNGMNNSQSTGTGGGGGSGGRTGPGNAGSGAFCWFGWFGWWWKRSRRKNRSSGWNNTGNRK